MADNTPISAAPADLTRDQLRRALDFQNQGIFQSLFASGEGYYTFREGHTEGAVEGRHNVLQLLLETCRLSDEALSDRVDP